LPVAAQPVVSATLGENDARYQVGSVGGALRVQNPAQALQADFTRQGMEVRSGQTHWRLALNGYGYGERLEKVGETAPQSRANRVEYQRGPLVEWYVNGPMGLEQGFTISAPPALGTRDTGHGKRDSSPLTIALELGGDLTATADSPAKGQGDARTEGLTLRDRHSQPVLRYSGLTARDASGRALVAWLELGKEELRLRVEDAGARYPVVVDPFVQQAVLTSSDSATGDEFGYSAAYSSDGTTIVAGAPYATIGTNTTQGAAYVFVMPSGGWATTSAFTAKLSNSGGVSGDNLGLSVSVSSNGSTVVAGVPGSNSSTGAAYVFVMPGTGWATTSTPTAVLTNSGGSSGDDLGYSVGVSSDGSTIVAGARGANSYQGAADVFVNPGTWTTTSTPTAVLTNSGGASGDQLGFSVGVSSNGSTIVAGAPQAGTGPGAAYVFVNPVPWATTSTPTAVLTNSGGALDDDLGYFVGISSDSSTIVAGAPEVTISGDTAQGAAYVFVNPGTWTTTSTPTAELSNTVTGASGDELGRSVSVSSNGSTIVAGAPFRNSGTGAVDVFVMPGTGWATTSTPTAQLAAPKVSSGNDFGYSVGVSGDGMGIAAGVPGLNTNTGAVSVNLTVPTVAFAGAPGSEPYGATFTVPSAATNSSTSPVYTASGACSNSGTTTYTMTSGTGTCEEIATWAADVNYASANVIQKTMATKIAPTVTFTDAPASAPYQGTFTVSSATDSSSLPVYTSSGSCSNSGATYTMTKGTGTCTSMVSWVADANYTRANMSQTTTGSMIGQTISFATPAPPTKAYKGTFPVAASSTSGLKVVLTASAGSVCSLGPQTASGGVTSATVTMTGGTGTCYIDANQAGNGNYTAATQQYTWAAALRIGQTITFTTPAPSSANDHSSFTVAANSTSGLKVVLSVDGGSTGVCSLGAQTVAGGVTSATVTMLSGTGTCTIDGNQAGNNNYTMAGQQQTSAAAAPAPGLPQTISFTTAAPPTETYKGTFPVAARSTSGLKVALSISAGSVCTLGPQTTTGGVTSATVTMTGGTGTCYIDANQAGNNTYDPAAQQQTWAAALRIGQTISFTTPAPSSAGINTTFPVAADSTSGLKVVFSVDAGSTGVCKVGVQTFAGGATSATVSMLKNTGTCTIDANQTGNNDYTPAAQQQTSAAATP
jgi:hypothetical protein